MRLAGREEQLCAQYVKVFEDVAKRCAYFVILPGDVIQQEAMKEPDSPVIQKMLLLREILSESFSIDPLVFLPF